MKHYKGEFISPFFVFIGKQLDETININTLDGRR